MRLQQKLILIITLYILLFVGFTTLYSASVQRNDALTNLEDRSAALIKVLSISSSSQLFWSNYDRLNQYARKIKESLPVNFVSIVDPEGTVMAHTDREKIGQRINFPDDFKILDSTGIRSRYNSDPDSTYMISYPIFILDKIVGYIILQYDTTTMEREIMEIFKSNFLLALVLCVVGMLVAAYTSHRITRPVQEVMIGLDRIASGEYEHKIKIDDHTDELNKLAHAFNNMGQKLNATIQKLDREKSQSEAIITSMSDGLMLIDTERRIRFLNKGAEQMLGYTSEEANDKICSEILNSPTCSSENCSLFCSGDIESAEQCADADTQIEISSKDGKKITILKSSAPLINQSGEVYGGVEVFKDITNMLTMENKLKQADRLASLGMLAAGMAHEINNPIAGIIGLSNALLRDFSGDPVLVEDLKIIKEQGQRCGRIIKNLMNLAVNAPKELALVDLNSVVLRTTKMITKSISDGHMVVNENYDPSRPVVMADEGQLMQVFTNIIRNAFAATDENGVLDISTNMTNGVAEVVFSDNGVGIPGTNISRVFDPFYTTKKVGEGMGLGLAVSHGIITSHGGEIKIESEAGKGTRFTVILRTSSGGKSDSALFSGPSLEEKITVNVE